MSISVGIAAEQSFPSLLHVRNYKGLTSRIAHVSLQCLWIMELQKMWFLKTNPKGVSIERLSFWMFLYRCNVACNSKNMRNETYYCKTIWLKVFFRFFNPSAVKIWSGSKSRSVINKLICNAKSLSIGSHFPHLRTTFFMPMRTHTRTHNSYPIKFTISAVDQTGTSHMTRLGLAHVVCKLVPVCFWLIFMFHGHVKELFLLKK